MKLKTGLEYNYQEEILDRLDSITQKKAELQSRGVRIPPELVAELEKYYNAPAVRTGRMVLCLESPANKDELIGAFIVNGKRGDTSPLSMAKSDSGGLEIRRDDVKFTDVTLLPRPRFYDRETAGGIPMHKLAVVVGPGHLRSVVNQVCHYHRIGQPCKFCAVQRWWDANVEKASTEIADAIAAAVAEGVAEHVSLTTATLDTPDKGLEDLVRTAELIREKTDAEIPVMLEFEPIEDSSLLEALLKRGKKAGVTTVSCNIECFDTNLREEIMPAKGRISVAVYEKTWEKCLEIFGANEVFTTAVAGIGEDDDSLISGIARTAERGVMTFLVPHSPAVGAAYEDMEAPSAAQMLDLYRRAVDIYTQKGLDLFACRAGCVRGGGFSAIKEAARFGA